MRIAIDVSPLQSGHKVRGVGFYLENLKNALVKYFPENEYIFFEQKKEITKKVDLIHYPYFEPFFITLPFFEQKKRVITVHDLTPIVFPTHFPAGIKGNLSWQIQKLNLIQSAAVITDSNSSSRDVEKYTGIASKKIQSVYLAAAEEFKQMNDGQWKKEILSKYNLPDKFVLYVGDVTWNKNIPRLVAAVKQLDLPLVMVGKSLVEKKFDRNNVWNKDRIEVEKQTKDDPRFIKLGFVSTNDLVALYNCATVFIFPSLYEGFGLPILEAMQSGCPVITTKEGSLVEVAGDAAYFVDGYSVTSIIDGIRTVFNDKKIQTTFIQKGLAQSKKFSWKQTAQKTLEVYQSILEQK